MKEIKLTEQDLNTIKAAALAEWREKSISYKTPDTFVCQCYVTAFLAFCNAKGYTVVEGKVYVK